MMDMDSAILKRERDDEMDISESEPVRIFLTSSPSLLIMNRLTRRVKK
jgi:hypothetical protein